MKRLCSTYLNNWLISEDRKPLVIRGARQVGKTWLVRHLASEHKKDLIELNFERNPELVSLFKSNDPQEILLNISAALAITFDPEQSLLFLDEIQAAPEILAKLRWFYEEMPELPVVTAGSLLEFVLDEHSFSMPVGRINYLHVEPLSFVEFLWAHDKKELVDYLGSYQWKTVIPEAIHDRLMAQFKDYLLIGGMPAAVVTWIKHRSFKKVGVVHQDLLATYRDDFGKYSGRLSRDRLEEVMAAVPRQLGTKFMYSKVNPEVQSAAVKQALNLLCKARICHYSNIPLGAEEKDGFRKVIFLDVGLCSSMLGLTLDDLIKEEELINKGGIAEQVIGQLLRVIIPSYKEPALYYWQRQQKGASAEIDYLIQQRTKLIPIEVKAGKAGRLKSLHYFIELKGLSYGVRIDSRLPLKSKVVVKGYEQERVEYTLLSLPFYLIEELPRLLNEVID